MPKVIGCMNCGYRTENKDEIDLFIINGCNCIAAQLEEIDLFIANGCNCIAAQLEKARKLRTELLKGHNINDPEQVKELAIVKDRIAQLDQELENQEAK